MEWVSVWVPLIDYEGLPLCIAEMTEQGKLCHPLPRLQLLGHKADLAAK